MTAFSFWGKLTLMPSSHCTILARFFTRQQVLINRRQMPYIRGKSVLVHASENRAVWIIKDAIWGHRRCVADTRKIFGMLNIWSCRRFTILGCVQPWKNGAKHLLNGNSGAMKTLFWWLKCCNYGSWEGHYLCSFWRIFGAWWNRYKYMFNTASYARCYSHCPCRPE